MLPKSLILSFITLCTITIPIYSFEFTFSSYKTTPEIGGELRKDFLQELAKIFNVNTFIETGTAGGGSTLQAVDVFSTIYTIELNEELYQIAKQRLADFTHVQLLLGESDEVLQQILPTIKERSLFWLDAHYCGEGSACGKNETPILEELEAIRQSGMKDCIILIDDIRGFGTYLLNKNFNSWPNYPTFQEIHKKLLCINDNFNFILLGDTLLAFDQTSYDFDQSPVAVACTASRLENVYNDQELLEYERIIGAAKDIELAYINTLYEDKKKYKMNFEYHIYLWRGLTLLHNKQYQEALKEFNHVINQGFQHWRIYLYAAQASKLLH